MMILIVVGGLLYTAGAIVYALKRPNPWPGRFGFHEIFHACTVLAFLCHWTRDPADRAASGALSTARADQRSRRLGVLRGGRALGGLAPVADAADAPGHVDDEQHHRDA